MLMLMQQQGGSCYGAMVPPSQENRWGNDTFRFKNFAKPLLTLKVTSDRYNLLIFNIVVVVVVEEVVVVVVAL